ncbi:uncharacterized protein THITE_2115309 [Thermothielavioides terrestris NRRL 8126]|uniref:Methyltransferase domain-containing protein n=1 Tax=Thermothielavioides terrestris (strain ATCC 38088 / NRRL 8126) TaxID=578455 RepID=G2R3Y8_THETT|nr:uncharacterized protein THITE_2115309 [Thermothielavioides terrestris NRRL 8126]AEO66840.1 hypothetical protein THITE_2115309 [Thermothielavioides terrestris NRRL 8126]
MDLHHHMCELLLGGKLCLTPLDPARVQKVVDIGTGTGLWAIDFGEAFPNAEVIGTDVSPLQPSWVPPNVKFELDDANLEWTWKANTFDFIHLRLMSGTISDWASLYREAFRCCKPGGWIEHQEGSFMWRFDKGIPEDSALGQFHKVFWEGGKKFGRTFRVVEDDIQRKYMEEAGFVDLVVKDIKCPLGDWPLDPAQKELGTFAKATFMSDIEGYLLYIFKTVMGWTEEETLVYCAHLRRQLKDPELQPYFLRRIVYGRKPEAS